MDRAAGISRRVWIFGERFRLTFYLKRNRHLIASAERLSRRDPITVVVILEVLDILQPIAHFIVAVKPESWHSAAGSKHEFPIKREPDDALQISPNLAARTNLAG